MKEQEQGPILPTTNTTLLPCPFDNNLRNQEVEVGNVLIKVRETIIKTEIKRTNLANRDFEGKLTDLCGDASVKHVRILSIVNFDEDKEIGDNSEKEHEEKESKENLYYSKAQKVERKLKERIRIKEPNLRYKVYYKETESGKFYARGLTKRFKEKSCQIMDIYQGFFEKFKNYFNLEEIRKMMEKGLNIFHFRASRYL
jgi:hypothetical protein